MYAYARMCASRDPVEIESIKKALLEYYKLDTLGMVKILDILKVVIS